MGESAIRLVPQEDEVTREVATIEYQARILRVVDAATYVDAADLWKAIRALRVKVADTFDKSIKSAHELHKGLVAKKKEHDGPLDAAERAVKQAMSDYDQEQERIRREEQRRLQEIARKEEEERLLMEAIAAEEEAKKNGLTKEEAKAEAEQIISQPVYVAPVVVPKATPKLQGGPVYRTIWKARVVNESIIPRQYMVPDMVKINGVARALKNQANIPGVEVYEERC